MWCIDTRWCNRTILGLAVVAWVMVGCAGNTPEPTTTSIPGMSKAVQYGDLLFGSQPAVETLAELQERGYKTILTTRSEGELKWDEKAEVESLGMTFVSIPMGNPVENITDEQVAAFAELMESGERPMVLHCGSGNRVSGLYAVWLVEHEGMDPEKALELAEKVGMTRVRPVVEKRLGE